MEIIGQVKSQEIFEKYFHQAPTLVSESPGRLEILGNHTDYNEGYVLSMAVNLKTYTAFRKTTNSDCKVISLDVEDKIREFNLNDISTPLEGNDWLNYVRGVFYEIQKVTPLPVGCEIAIYSDIPRSAGMSSSAALEMALVKGIVELYGLNLEPIEMAKIGQAVENNYLGANTGLMDQLTSLCSQASSLLQSEYRNITYKHLPISTDYSWVVINSEVAHDLSKEYNERRQQCEQAVEELQSYLPEITALRDVTPEQLSEYEDKLDPLAYKRAMHVVTENRRVHQAKDKLETWNYQSFGQLLFESHSSSINNFENSCPELDSIVEAAKSSSLCLGARLSGGGFGGIAICLVNSNGVEAFTDEMAKALKKQFPNGLQMFACLPVEA